ncbi:hypothetical protein FRC09_010253 [Ceratobasidium sp. 395]|nr:hypothetical protein FRC09_010253 [Ceratobasidium sp. 395]
MSSDDESTHTVGDEYVDIPDENGQLQPWKVLTRPKKLPDNLNIRKAMELDSEESDPDETNRDAQERRTANAAKKMIYRSICQNIRHALNASQPNALNGHTRWSHISSHTRALVHETALGEEPYLKRFPGGWISEQIMKQQLRNKRETKTRAGKQASAQKISKPMQLLAPKPPTESRARTANANRTPRTTAPPAQPANDSDSDADDEGWGQQVNAELSRLGRKPQQGGGDQPASTAGAGPSTRRKTTMASSSANPPPKSKLRPRMRPPPTPEPEPSSEPEPEPEPEAVQTSTKGKGRAKGLVDSDISLSVFQTHALILDLTNSKQVSKKAKTH